MATANDEHTTTASVGYRTRILDGVNAAAREDAPYAPASGRLEKLTRRRDGRSAAARTGRAEYRGHSQRIAVEEPGYIVARTDDLMVEPRATPSGQLLTYTEAAEALRRERDHNPERAKRLQLVTRHEALGALFEPQKPGETPQQPGEYLESGPAGERIRHPRQVTIEPGDEPLPPTQEPGRTWLWIGPPDHPEESS